MMPDAYHCTIGNIGNAANRQHTKHILAKGLSQRRSVCMLEGTDLIFDKINRLEPYTICITIVNKKASLTHGQLLYH